MCQRTSHRHMIFCILPPNVLRSIAEKGTQQQREAVLRTLSMDTTFRALRANLAPVSGAARRRKALAVEPRKQRTIYTRSECRWQKRSFMRHIQTRSSAPASSYPKAVASGGVIGGRFVGSIADVQNMM